MGDFQKIAERPRPRLLIIDDDPMLVLLLREALGDSEWVIRSANNGIEGLVLFKQDCFDLVLIDVVLPLLDGFSVCRNLRQANRGKDVPIMMITGLDDLHCIDQAYKVGATDFITKPVNWALLPHRLRYILRATQAFAALRKSEMQLNLAQQIAQVGSWEWNRDTAQFHFSAETARLLGIELGSSIVGCPAFFVNVDRDTRDCAGQQFSTSALTGEPFSMDLRVSDAGVDSSRIVLLHAEWVPDAMGIPQTVLTGTVQDVTHQRTAAEKIEQLAFYDALTGLANRRLFKERLATVIEENTVDGRACAILFMDVDNFKHINDIHGHDAGDSILIQLSHRLQAVVLAWQKRGRNRVGGAPVLVARIGGDEFTILMPHVTSHRQVSSLAASARNGCRKPFEIGGAEIALSVSIGISMHPHDGLNISELLKASDMAMYHAKRMGKNNYQFYDPSTHRMGKRRADIETELRRAFEREELELYYQPRVNVENGVITGVEALLRWTSARLGEVTPGEFIPVAEATGLIVPIGEWVIQTAIKQARPWLNDADLPIRLAINISVWQFKHPTFLHIVRRCVDSELIARELEWEITETVILDDSEFTKRTMLALKEMESRIVVDDFGAGYASLSYLKRLPIDALKIDRSFIEGLPDRASDTAITSAIIDLTRGLNLDVVAEGVETVEQLRFLQDRRCGQMQGFLFSPAVRPDLMEKMITAQRLTHARIMNLAENYCLGV